MSEMIPTNVLIVGSGPTGMTMALALAKFGISSILIDRRETIYGEPRAHALNPRTLEIFDALGIDNNKLKSMATPVDQSCWVRWVDTLNGGEFGKLPYERMHEDDTLPTPWPLFNIAQPVVETDMQRHIESNDAITALRPWQWKSCEQRVDGVVSLVVDEKGQEHQIFSRYLIGADGAGSPVREAMGIEMEGMGIIQNFCMIHFKADLRKIVEDKPAVLYWIMRQECSGTFISYDAKENWVFMYPYDDLEINKSAFTPEYCKELVLNAIGRSDIDIEILTNGGWGLGSQIAERYRHQNVFLVGDAAHRFPPSGGLGLNTGVGDAHNLAWKIGGVLKGWAWPKLLESYEAERKQVARHNADFSTENAGKLFYVMLETGTLMPDGMQPSFEALKADTKRWNAIQENIEAQRDHFDGLALQIGQHYGRAEAPDLRADDFQSSEVGARFPHAWLSINGKRASSHLLLSATKFTLVLRDGVELPKFISEVPHQLKVENQDFAADTDALRAMGLDQAQLVIIRPDGHISKRFESEPITANALMSALSKAAYKFVALDEKRLAGEV